MEWHVKYTDEVYISAALDTYDTQCGGTVYIRQRECMSQLVCGVTGIIWISRAWTT